MAQAAHFGDGGTIEASTPDEYWFSTKGLESIMGSEWEKWGEIDDVEYVWVDDEKGFYKDFVSDDDAIDSDYVPSSD
ncbi:hypothetical protein E2562_017553 [Oryza meyeriana var. granulata]|uniref:Uncharacterized protein n=1 Tax=Oryza meyeriana var. granulata TaxID=110450 RepID=A0A6G1C6P1_9ORYZ|nr:hypothetical protein E2562_017553 [Oryza meyeriana var. granulata]